MQVQHSVHSLTVNTGRQCGTKTSSKLQQEIPFTRVQCTGGLVCDERRPGNIYLFGALGTCQECRSLADLDDSPTGKRMTQCAPGDQKGDQQAYGGMGRDANDEGSGQEQGT